MRVFYRNLLNSIGVEAGFDAENNKAPRGLRHGSRHSLVVHEFKLIEAGYVSSKGDYH